MVHVYYASVSPLLEEEVFWEKLKLVSRQRRDKILRCKNSMDQRRSLAGGLLFRHGCLREGWNQEELAEGEYGKPLMQKAHCYFNLSHAGDYAAAVFSDSPVGVDIESCRRFDHRRNGDVPKAEGFPEKSMDRFAEKVLSQKEQEIFLKIPAERRPGELVRIWTRKEAYAKAVGKGLAMEFSGIDTRREEWYYTTIIGEDYWLSICVPEAGERAFWEQICMEKVDF